MGFRAACLLHRHRNVAEVCRRQGSELLLPDAEVSAARVYLLHHHRLAAAHTDGLHSHNQVGLLHQVGTRLFTVPGTPYRSVQCYGIPQACLMWQPNSTACRRST